MSKRSSSMSVISDFRYCCSIQIFLLWCTISIAFSNAASVGHINGKATDICNSQIYCTGKLLKTVQLANIFNDSKTFVDLYQLHDPDVTLANFNKLMEETSNEPNRTEVLKFVQENFAQTSELEDWTPPDWHANPLILQRVQDLSFRDWVKKLNDIWKTLSKKIRPEVADHPDRHSIINVPNGFIIPGGRFKEFYYWDSYWVIEGLLLSDMKNTARGMIENFLSMVQNYGFIPNGARVYYLMRSQPPLLIPMVEKYLEFTNDVPFLSKIIGILEKEFAFWQRERTVDVTKNGKTYKLGRYIVSSDGPRPESYREDYEIAEKIKDKSKVQLFYEDIKAAAESGWDFSARWFISEDGSKGTLSDVSTRNIIPVDLNAFLQHNARTLAKFYILLGKNTKAKYYMKIAQQYQDGIDNVLWNEEFGIWLDYDIKNGKSRKSFYPSNLAPLYTKSYDLSKAADFAQKAVNYLKKNEIEEYLGGTPASLDYTGEQWDYPNAWPPLQSIVVAGLYRTGQEPAVSFAKKLAVMWLRANFAGFTEYNAMFEKYDAVNPGQYGGGGEYVVQKGFGWTNGIVLEFLDMFPTATHSDNFDDHNDIVDR